MTRLALVRTALLALLLATAAGCGGSGDGSGGTGGEAQKGGILTLGSTSYIDSLNPFNYIESQAYNAMLMVYPQLVEYGTAKNDPEQLEVVGEWAESWETSADGKDWTFTLKPGGKWRTRRGRSTRPCSSPPGRRLSRRRRSRT
jgi:peptide/nickel transport system substrate-binding protein